MDIKAEPMVKIDGRAMFAVQAWQLALCFFFASPPCVLPTLKKQRKKNIRDGIRRRQTNDRADVWR